MLQLSKVAKYYGDFAAVKDVSLQIPPAQVWALAGPNGAGKTTLLKMMAGLLQPDQGSLTWEGISPLARPEAFKALVCYVPQKAGLYPNLTVEETLRFFARLRGADNLATVQERFALTEIRGRQLRTLSGGQRQRVVVAQAFLGCGKYLLLDECTSNLDVQTTAIIKQELRRFADQGGSVILSSHIAGDLATGLIDHLIFMENGTVSRVA